MTGTSSYIYSDEYLRYNFGPTHPFKSIRCKLTLDILRDLGAFNDRVKVVVPSPASYEDLVLVHTKEYVEYVRERSEAGYGFLDTGDTPATKGLFEGSCAIVGGSILGARLIIDGEIDHAFNAGGGLHHARAGAASGFCVFNDIVIASEWMRKNRDIRRIAIVDIDGHHGDGTQEFFYKEPILKISSQRIGIFPGTGYIDEVGEGSGKGYSVNIPLPGNTADQSFLYAYEEIVPPLLKWYQPEIILCQCGIDGHIGDPLVGLALTTRTYETVAKSLHDLSHELCQGRLLLFGGGGYDVAATARCWALVFAVVSEVISRSKCALLQDEEQLQENPAVTSRVKVVVKEVKDTIFKMNGLCR